MSNLHLATFRADLLLSLAIALPAVTQAQQPDAARAFDPCRQTDSSSPEAARIRWRRVHERHWQKRVAKEHLP